MPGFDGTGPWGEGPMTGGGFGYCNPGGSGYGRQGRRFSGRGRGLRRGFGPGRGSGRGFGWGPGPQYGPGWYGPAYTGPNAMNPQDELDMLQEQAAALQQELESIHKRMEKLAAQSPDAES